MITAFYNEQGLTKNIDAWISNFEGVYGRSNANCVFVKFVSDGRLKPFC